MHYNKCIYCDKEKEINELSLEHIFPDSLGGTYANSIFKTRQVCKKCNNLSGLYVDSAFVKNFFATTLEIFSDYLGYYDFDKDPYIPFSYMGFVEYVKHPNYEFCEKWLWLGGSTVYHFHNNSEEDFETIAGGDPRKRKNKNAGEVYLVGLTDNEFWIKLLLQTFIKQFKKSKQILVNYKISKLEHILDIEQSKIKDSLFDIHKIRDMQRHTIAINLGFNIRFQAKIAIGLGYSLFGEKFAESEEANSHRNIFWNRSYSKLTELQPKTLPFFSKQKNEFTKYAKVLNFKGCHGLFFLNINNSLYFYGNMYGKGKYPILTIITNELNSYQHELISKYPNGWGYILVPQRKLCIGAFDIASLLAFNTEDKTFLPELVELEKKYISTDKLPPFNLDIVET